MEVVVKQFVEHTPPALLQKYRQQMCSSFSTLTSTVFRSLQSMLHGTRYSPSFENVVLTGSAAEGASLARLFSSDLETAAEAEVDLMVELGTFDANSERKFCYVAENNAFLHVEIDDSTFQKFRSAFGDPLDESASSCVIVHHEDGKMYMNCLELKDAHQLGYSMIRPILNSMSGGNYEAADETDDEVLRCSAAQNVVDMWPRSMCDLVRSYEDHTGSQARCASVQMHTKFASGMKNTRREDEIMSEILTSLHEVDRTASQMLGILQICDDELTNACNPVHEAPLEVQVSKATEYVETAMRIFEKTFGIWDLATSKVFCNLLGFPAEVMSSHWKGCASSISTSLQTLLTRLKPTTVIIHSATNPSMEVNPDITVRQTIKRIMVNFVSKSKLFLVLQHEFSKLIQFRDMLKTSLEIEREKTASEEWNKLIEIVGKTSMDFVLCVRLDFWPRVAGEWLTRDRQWPDKATIHAIEQNGAHMIGKQFCHPDIDWRLSFSVAEISLAQLWTAEQHFVYFIFKSLFYRFVKDTNGNEAKLKTKLYSKQPTETSKTISSYLAKTAMMHVSESFPQSWWSVENASECLSVLFLSLQSSLECGRLDHYFIPSVNLLEGITEKHLAFAFRATKRIQADPDRVVREIESHFEAVKGFFQVANKQEVYAHSCADLFSRAAALGAIPKELSFLKQT